MLLHILSIHVILNKNKNIINDFKLVSEDSLSEFQYLDVVIKFKNSTDL